MKHISLLKKLAFLADRLEKYSNVDFSDAKIKVNTLLINSELLSYALKVLCIPYEEYTPNHDTATAPDEMNFSVGSRVDIRILYVLAYVAKEVYDNNITMYVNYATEPEGREKSVFFGTYVTVDEDFTNISRQILLSQVISLNIDEMDWEQFSELFPNVNYSADGGCTYTWKDKHDDYEGRNDYSNKPDYERDTFDALTDGQYGDYDDWRESGGDMDSLRDALGY